jgi:hypothetical protein
MNSSVLHIQYHFTQYSQYTLDVTISIINILELSKTLKIQSVVQSHSRLIVKKMMNATGYM